MPMTSAFRRSLMGRGYGSFAAFADPEDIEAPENTIAPAITGTPTLGQTLTCSAGTWANSPTSYARQWKRGGVNIAGATGSTYVLQAADIGSTITCLVTASNAGGSASQISNTTAAIAGLAPLNTVAPAVTGTPTEGETLTTTTGTWSYSPTSYAYQWRRVDLAADISGATGSTLVLGSGDVGHTIACRVTATNATGSTTQQSNTTGAIAAAGGGGGGGGSFDFSDPDNSSHIPLI